VVLLAIVIVGNTGLFAKALRLNWQIPTTGGTISSIYGLYSASGIGENDRQMDAAVAAVRRFDPENTIVLGYFTTTTAIDWRHLMFYLPEYRVMGLTFNSASYFDFTNHAGSVNSGGDIALATGGSRRRCL
jgi:hypothetical protein